MQLVMHTFPELPRFYSSLFIKHETTRYMKSVAQNTTHKKKIKWRVVLCMADSGSRYHVPKLKMLYFEREKGHLCRHWNKDYSHIHAHTTFSFFPSYICSNPTWKTLSLPEGGSTKERSPEVQLNANVGELKTYTAREISFRFLHNSSQHRGRGMPWTPRNGTLKRNKQVPAPNFQQMARQNPLSMEFKCAMQCKNKAARPNFGRHPRQTFSSFKKHLKRRQHSHLLVNLYRNVSFGPWKASESKNSGLRRE